jgi:hypothetical protein
VGIEIQPPGPATQSAPAASLSTHTSATGPGAAGSLGAINGIPAGTYEITVYLSLSGTTSSADQDNVRLQVDNATILTLPLNTSLTTGVVMPPFNITLPSVGTNIRCQAIAAGTGTAVYDCTIVATRVA